MLVDGTDERCARKCPVSPAYSWDSGRTGQRDRYGGGTVARPQRVLTQAQLFHVARLQLIAQLVLTVVLTAVVFHVMAVSTPRHSVMAASVTACIAFSASLVVALVVYRTNKARARRRGNGEP